MKSKAHTGTVVSVEPLRDKSGRVHKMLVLVEMDDSTCATLYMPPGEQFALGERLTREWITTENSPPNIDAIPLQSGITPNGSAWVSKPLAPFVENFPRTEPEREHLRIREREWARFAVVQREARQSEKRKAQAIGAATKAAAANEMAAELAHKREFDSQGKRRVTPLSWQEAAIKYLDETENGFRDLDPDARERRIEALVRRARRNRKPKPQ